MNNRRFRRCYRVRDKAKKQAGRRREIQSSVNQRSIARLLCDTKTIIVRTTLVRSGSIACNFLGRLRAHHVASRNYRGATSLSARSCNLWDCAHICHAVHGIVIGSQCNLRLDTAHTARCSLRNRANDPIDHREDGRSYEISRFGNHPRDPAPEKNGGNTKTRELQRID